MSTTAAKRNEEFLRRLDYFYYSPFDEWRNTELGTKVDGAFVRNEYLNPLPGALFERLLTKGSLTLPDGRAYELETFDP